MTMMTKRTAGAAAVLVALVGSALVAPTAAEAAPAPAATPRAVSAPASARLVNAKTPSLTIKSNHAIYAYGQKATISIHLGATHTNRKVTLTAIPYGGTRMSVTHAVDSKGNFTDVYGPLSRTTSFYAHFAHDDQYNGRTVKIVRTVHSKVVTEITGGYTSKNGYRYVHVGKKGYFTVGAAPKKTSKHVQFMLQRFVSGSWHTIQRRTETLNSKSVTGVSITGVHNGSYRVRGYLGADKSNAATYTKFGYFRFI